MKAVIKVATTALLATTCLGQDVQPKKQVFFDKTNIALFSADLLVRTLDAQSTEAFLHDPCRCYTEKYISFATGTPAGTYAFSVGMAGAVMGASYIAYRLHHPKLAHLIPVADIAVDFPAVVGNWDRHHPNYTTPIGPHDTNIRGKQ